MEKINPKVSESHTNRYISKQRSLLLISVVVRSKYKMAYPTTLQWV